LDDTDAAIKLLPQMPGLYINRAFLRYNLDDYFGAMSDYDYAITLDPTNPTAYFNRGLLRAEVADNDKAINDFSTVLSIDPTDVRSLYNRAMLYRSTRNYSKAIADIDKVIEAFPDMSAPVFFRFEIYDEMGNRALAMRDYDKAMALAKEERRLFDSGEYKDKLKGNSIEADLLSGDEADASERENSGNETVSPEKNAEIFANRFSLLLTADNELEQQGEYNNKSIKGKVQDYNVSIRMQEPFMLSFYSSPTELAPTTYFMQEIEGINNTRALRMLVQIVNNEPALDSPDIMQRHIDSIEYYNSYISTHAPRAIDYFGRGMDYLMLHNYEAAVEDMNRAIDMAPDFTLAYFARANALTRLYQLSSGDGSDDTYQGHIARVRRIFEDYGKVIEYSPRSPFPHYNMGILYAESGDLKEALKEFTRAIELKSDFGEAYYNRGFVQYKLGNQKEGSADLSRAGQLGITQSYNLLKRMK
ncbi:MAG: tetratricopeptide repeat protein, partial [Bacteroides sp.]|nr:tetratricopeptide repeat protein [Bacteroides sp.]